MTDSMRFQAGSGIRNDFSRTANMQGSVSSTSFNRCQGTFHDESARWKQSHPNFSLRGTQQIS
jgi:hypothetical protein